MITNMLGNFMLLHTTISSEQWFKILPYLQTMPIADMESQRIEHEEYKMTRSGKGMFSKNKNVVQEYQMVVVRNSQVCFMWNREKGERGSMAISEAGFMDNASTKNILPGQLVLVNQKYFILQGISWQSYIIYYTQLPNKQILLLIQQTNAVTLFKQNQFDQQLTDRLKKFYEPVLYQMVGDKESKNIVERYGVYLRELLERNKEMTRIGVDSTVNQKIKEIDFNLVMFYALAQAFKDQ